MQRTYPYNCFEVTVSLEPVWLSSRRAVPSPLDGYVAIESIGVKGLPAALLPPIRLMNENQKPFGTEAAALMAGFSAGQRVIDDTLMSG